MKNKEIIKEFDETFVGDLGLDSECWHKTNPQDIRNFITKALISQQESVEKEIRGLKKIIDIYDDTLEYGKSLGYNQALQDILTKIRQ